MHALKRKSRLEEVGIGAKCGDVENRHAGGGRIYYGRKLPMSPMPEEVVLRRQSAGWRQGFRSGTGSVARVSIKHGRYLLGSGMLGGGIPGSLIQKSPALEKEGDGSSLISVLFVCSSRS